MYLIASSSSLIFLAQGIIGENMPTIKIEMSSEKKSNLFFVLIGPADMKSK